MRIYIAGPYCPRTTDIHEAAREAQHNVDVAIEIANELFTLGHYPHVPHLTHYIHTHYSSQPREKSLWYKYDDTYLEHWAEALYYIGPSPGADHELYLALKLGLKIYHSLEEVRDAE